MVSFPWQDSFKNWQRTFSLKNYFRAQVLVLKSIGLWPIEYENYLPVKLKFLSIYLNACFFAFNLTIDLFLTLCLIITVFTNGGSLDELAQYILASIVYFFMNFVRIYFTVKYREMRRLVEFLNANLLSRSAVGLTYITIEPSYKYAIWLILTWLGGCLMGALHWSAIPILVQERILPFESWYPFDGLKSPIYEMVYLMQAIGQIHSALLYGIAIGMYLSVAFLISSQFDILFCSLKNTYNTALIKSGDRTTMAEMLKNYDKDLEEINQYYLGNELMEDFEEHIPPARTQKVSSHSTAILNYNISRALADSVTHHLMILKLCQMMEEFFRFYLFGILMHITSLSCFLAFMATALTDQNLVNMFEYLFLIQMKLLMLSYFAEILKDQSTRVGSALLRSPWYLFGPREKRSVMIILINSMKPTLLTVQKIYVMDTRCMAAVIKTTFSFYTILLNMRDK